MENETLRLLGEEDFEKEMQTTVEPYLAQYQAQAYYEGYDGNKLYYASYILPQAKADIIIFHGFCEFAEKYQEVIYYFLKKGYSVWIPEQRGHGHSYRMLSDLNKVQVQSFDEYVKDMDIFVKQVLPPDSNKYLFAHSMGGAIAIRYVQENPQVFEKVVLSSPMCKMKTGQLPTWLALVISEVKCRCKKGAEYALGQHGFRNEPKFEGSCCVSEARYLYQYRKRQENEKYRTSGGTYDWVRAGLQVTKAIRRKGNLDKICEPILVFQAGDDHMVQNEVQNYVLEHLPTAKMIVLKEARHEIFNAAEHARDIFYRELFKFLEEK